MKSYIPSASDHSFFLPSWGREHKSYCLDAKKLKCQYCLRQLLGIVIVQASPEQNVPVASSVVLKLCFFLFSATFPISQRGETGYFPMTSALNASLILY